MTVDNEKLIELRKKTKLNIFERIKLQKLILMSIEKKRLICELENCDIEADASEANEYEYQRRLKKYNRSRRFKGYGRYY